jgi:hypothetical protein
MAKDDVIRDQNYKHCQDFKSLEKTSTLRAKTRLLLKAQQELTFIHQCLSMSFTHFGENKSRLLPSSVFLNSKSSKIIENLKRLLYFEVKIINASLSHLKFSSGLNIQLIL